MKRKGGEKSKKEIAVASILAVPTCMPNIIVLMEREFSDHPWDFPLHSLCMTSGSMSGYLRLVKEEKKQEWATDK